MLEIKEKGGLAAAVACVAAMYAKDGGPGLTAFSDGGERPVAERLAWLPRSPKSKRRRADEEGKKLQPILEMGGVVFVGSPG